MLKWRVLVLGSFFAAAWVACGNDTVPSPANPAGLGEAGAGSGGSSAGRAGAGRASVIGGAAGADETGTGGKGGRSSGRGGTSGATDEGGAGAEAGSSGTGAQAGKGGSGGKSSAAGGSAGKAAVPQFWKCPPEAYGDGTCDCGCNEVDSDCAHGFEIDECERCNSTGSCSGAACPGRINPDFTDSCLPVPDDWACPASAYADGQSCDCGCGLTDPDCPDDKATSCDRCDLGNSCGNGPCPTQIDPMNNAVCFTPKAWVYCAGYQYGDGYCDCGCGIKDIDCETLEEDECVCNNCRADLCTGGKPVLPHNNAVCAAAPPYWTCASNLYNDGVCTCGCGGPDPDCDPFTLDSCAVCNDTGSCSTSACPGNIDPEDPAHCTN